MDGLAGAGGDGSADAGDGEDADATDDAGTVDATVAASGGNVVADVSVAAATVEDVEAIMGAGEYRDTGGVAVFVSEEDKIAAGRAEQNLKRQPLNDPDRVGVDESPAYLPGCPHRP